MKQNQHQHENTLFIPLSIVGLILVILLGWWFMGSRTTVGNCEFPRTATDLREAGKKLSEEINGSVGYSNTNNTITIESSNGFVLLSPVTDEMEIIDTLRTQITETLGCEGTTDLAYWVFDVSDPNQLPPEILTQLGDERPDQILLILGSLYVFSVDALVTNPNTVRDAVTRIVIDRGGPRDKTDNSPFTKNQTPGTDVLFSNTPAPAALELPFSNSSTGNTSTGGGSNNGGFIGGGSGTGSNIGRPVSSGGNPSVNPTQPQPGSQCNLKIVCEDRDTGDQYEPGPSGCQGTAFYNQTPTPPQNTRQVAICLDANGNIPGSCPSDYWFHFRNCVDEANNLGLAGSDAVGITPEAYDAIAGQLPGNSARGAAGTLFTVPPTYNASPVNYTVRCSYPDQTVAIQCGMPGSGEYCLPGFNPTGCVAPPADFPVE